MFESKFWTWFARIATIIGLITGGLALYDYVTDDPYTIEYEQKLSPDAAERYDAGEVIEKGVRIIPEGAEDESRSRSD